LSSQPDRIQTAAWGDDLSRALPLIEGEARRPNLLRRWSGENVVIEQPPLDHHLVVLHLGGPKRVKRLGEGPSVAADVPCGAVTVIPSGAQYRWVTDGPIDFVHFYVDPARFNQALAKTFDRDHSQISLAETVGVVDELMASLIRTMVQEMGAAGAAGSSYFDRLYDTALAHLAFQHSSLAQTSGPARHSLSPFRLKRVLEFIEANVTEGFELSQLAETADCSRFHFSRAFHSAMGEPPMAYALRRRIEASKRMLRSESCVGDVASRMGFASQSHFTVAFRKITGVTPSAYRSHL
jgi:AraC family transcriptional regulator